ncbi:MAG: RluA family pseudouridine synthase [Phreatobacter sp.]|uniref:RluA family pseudouridine synthase n=1 Tax=Phreatobacter sp. TaxID=1966341 RepID=UPI001A4D6995|nr:RluA family pseudouridine synthase [Phreatobacter sp.]MBL8570074.1 RluA family pseudouridine synthase [Phreatobacter sp.]
MKGRGKPPGRGGAGKGPQGRGPGAQRPPGKRPAAGAKPPRARGKAPASRDEAEDKRGRKPSRPPEAGRRRDDARPFAKPAPHRGEDRRSLERVRRVPPREQEFRSFDEAPRRGQDDDWDADDRGWSPEDDLDIAAIEEPRDQPRAPARKPAGSGERRSPQRRDESGRDEPRRDEARRAAPTGPTRAELKAAATATLQTGVQTLTVTADEADMRVDRFLAARFPQLSFSYIQRIVRKGELRVNGRRVETKDRLEPGQAVRVPPLKLDQARPISAKVGEDIAGFLASITLYEDKDVLVLSKPAGLAVQGGSGTKKHLDGMLAVLTDEDGQRPRLVHRLDKDTSGCLLVARTRFAAAALAKTFRSRAARKIYWAVVAGVPKPRQGRVSTYLAKEEREDESFMRIAKHGERGASHAVSYYAVIDTMAQKLSWLSMKPVTGRTHQLRVHAAEVGNPIIGDPKYFDVENWDLPGGIQKKLHLHARRIVVPHPRGKGTIDISAPLPPHMEQTFNLLGWDVSRYDPIVEAPEE